MKAQYIKIGHDCFSTPLHNLW